MQFTDMHYEHGNPVSDTTLLNYKRILDAEKPNLIVFTGDIVTAPPVVEAWNTITQYAIDREIPFGVHSEIMTMNKAQLAPSLLNW